VSAAGDTAATPHPERGYLLQAGERYWPRGRDALQELPIPRVGAYSGAYERVPLPGWAAGLGPGQPRSLLVDSARLASGAGEPHERCDWWGAAWDLLTGVAEQRAEERRGPVHSYALRTGLPVELFERAWVNWILLFLRRWAARAQGRPEEEVFGPLPEASIDLTHDVDAVDKTRAIRVKRAAFSTVNLARLTLRGRLRGALAQVGDLRRGLRGSDDYWCFDEIRALEEEHDVRSTFHVYAGQRSWREPHLYLLDPSYDVAQPRLVAELRSLRAGGWTVGLHPSFASWRDPARLEAERRALESAAGGPVERCRQHWLRFSWEQTWVAQEAAGLRLDSTLGFNDRPGFRVSACLKHRPWLLGHAQPLRLEALPMVLMDSHLYDYAALGPEERAVRMKTVLDEVRAVRGEASVVWHQRVMSPDYGWGEGYALLLRLLHG
jgi:hypothetical protein